MVDSNPSSANTSIASESSTAVGTPEVTGAGGISMTDVKLRSPSPRNKSVKKPKRKALVSGLYADEFVLRWESEDELGQIHAERKKELNPKGRAEEETVLDITYVMWLKRCVVRIEQIRLTQRPSALRPNADERQCLHEFQEALSLSEAIWRDLEVVPLMEKGRHGLMDLDAAKRQMTRIRALIVDFIIPSLSNGTATAPIFAVPSDITCMEHGISLEPVFDGSLSKAISRLRTLKTHKQFSSSANNCIKAQSSTGSTSSLVPEMPNQGDAKEKSRKPKRKKQNALAHGAYAFEIVLQGESEDDFNRLHAELREELKPQGRTEEELVLDMACCMWRKHRILRSEPPRLNESLLAGLSLSSKSWPGILKDVAAGVSQQKSKALSCVEDILRILESVSKNMEPADAEADRFWLGGIEDARRELQQIQGLFRELIQHPDYATTSAVAAPADASVTDFSVIEQSMKLVARINANFDSKLSNLIELQNQKRSLAS